MALPSVSHLNPMLARCYSNQWLDTLSDTLGQGHSLAMAANDHRIPDVFDHLSKTKEQNFRWQIDHIGHQWHIECLQSNISAGFVVKVSGGSLTGKHWVLWRWGQDYFALKCGHKTYTVCVFICWHLHMLMLSFVHAITLALCSCVSLLYVYIHFIEHSF